MPRGSCGLSWRVPWLGRGCAGPKHRTVGMKPYKPLTAPRRKQPRRLIRSDAPRELWLVMARALVGQGLRRPETQNRWDEALQALDRAAEKTPEAPDPI